MRTPFSVRLARPSLHLPIAVLALCSACSDAPTASRPAPPSSPTRGDSALMNAIDNGERALAVLRQSEKQRGTARDTVLDRQIALLSRRLDGWRSLQRSPGISMELMEEGALQEGIIIDEETWTRVELSGWGDTPLATLQTTLSTPALQIGTNTSGSATVKGHTYPVSASFTGFGYYDFRTFRLSEVDCSKAGAYVVLSTWHYANWFYGKITDSNGWKHSTANDSCPPVAPIPHFTLTAQGKYGEDNELFEVTGAKGAVVGVTLSASNVQFDAPITSYKWYRNGVKFADGASTTIWVSENNTGIRLEVTDGNGLKGSADGVIALVYSDGSTPPPAPKPEEEGGGSAGGGGDEPTPYPPMEPPPPEPGATYTCVEIYEKMHVTWGSAEWDYWQDRGRQCGWVDVYNRLPKPGALATLPSRQRFITAQPALVKRP